MWFYLEKENKKKSRKKKFLLLLGIVLVLLIAFFALNQQGFFNNENTFGLFSFLSGSNLSSEKQNTDLSNLVCVDYIPGENVFDLFSSAESSSTSITSNNLSASDKSATDETSVSVDSSEKNNNGDSIGGSSGSGNTSSGNGNSNNGKGGNNGQNDDVKKNFGQICFTDTGEPVFFIDEYGETQFISFVENGINIIIDKKDLDKQKVIMKILD